MRGTSQRTGLGLAISKQDIERLGGSIHGRSRPREGATFYLDIPEAPSVR
ncbi:MULTISPECIES: ATP-binding protein [unclassified Sphingobium]